MAACELIPVCEFSYSLKGPEPRMERRQKLPFLINLFYLENLPQNHEDHPGMPFQQSLLPWESDLSPGLLSHFQTPLDVLIKMSTLDLESLEHQTI